MTLQEYTSTVVKFSLSFFLGEKFISFFGSVLCGGLLLSVFISGGIGENMISLISLIQPFH
jgi:hypothetical protein